VVAFEVTNRLNPTRLKRDHRRLCLGEVTCSRDFKQAEWETSPMDQLLTTDQAFEAMRHFLAQFNEREPPERKETIQFILSWTSRTGVTDGGTSDPAQWFDWKEAVAKAVTGEVVEGY
jgi:hypothetical protein